MRTVLRESPIPLGEQIRSQIASAIDDGTFGAGDQLPTEQQLAEQFGVSLAPVRTALDHLEKAGQIRKVRGRGSFVAPRALAIQIGSTPSITDALRRSGESFTVTMDHRELVPPPSHVVDAFAPHPLGQVIWIRRVITVNGLPCAVAASWLDADVFGSVLDAAPFDENNSLHGHMVHEVGVVPTRRTGTIELVAADPELAATLDVAPTSPLLKIAVTSYDRSGSAVELSHITYRPSAFQFRFGNDLE